MAREDKPNPIMNKLKAASRLSQQMLRSSIGNALSSGRSSSSQPNSPRSNTRTESVPNSPRKSKRAESSSLHSDDESDHGHKKESKSAGSSSKGYKSAQKEIVHGTVKPNANAESSKVPNPKAEQSNAIDSGCHGAVPDDLGSSSRNDLKCHAGAVNLKLETMVREDNNHGVDAAVLSCHGSAVQHNSTSSGDVPASCHGSASVDQMRVDSTISDGIDANDLHCHGGVHREMGPSPFDPKCHAGAVQQDLGSSATTIVSTTPNDAVKVNDVIDANGNLLQCHGVVQKDLAPSRFDPKCHAGVAQRKISTERYENSHVVDAKELSCHGAVNQDSQSIISQPKATTEPSCHGAMQQDLGSLKTDSKTVGDGKRSESSINALDLQCHGGAEHHSGASKIDPKCHAGALHLRIPTERLDDNSHSVDAAELQCHGAGVQHHLGPSEFDPKCHAGATQLRIPSHSVDANEPRDDTDSCHGVVQQDMGPSKHDPKCHAGTLQLRTPTETTDDNNPNVDGNDIGDFKISESSINANDLQCHGDVRHHFGSPNFDPKCHVGALHLTIPKEKLDDNSLSVDVTDLQCHADVQKHLGPSEFNPKCHGVALQLRIPSHGVDAYEQGDGSDVCHGVVQQHLGASEFDPKCHAGALHLRKTTEILDDNNHSVDTNDPEDVKIGDTINVDDLHCHGGAEHQLGPSKFNPKCHAGALHRRIPTERLEDNIHTVDGTELQCHGGVQHHLGSSEFDPKCHAGALQLKIPSHSVIANEHVDNSDACHGVVQQGMGPSIFDPKCHAGSLQLRNPTERSDDTNQRVNANDLQCHAGVECHSEASKFDPKCHAGALHLRIPRERLNDHNHFVDSSKLSCHGGVQHHLGSSEFDPKCHAGALHLRIPSHSVDANEDGDGNGACHGGMQHHSGPSEFDPKCHAGALHLNGNNNSVDSNDPEDVKINDNVNVDDLHCHGGVEHNSGPSKYDPKCHAGALHLRIPMERLNDSNHIVDANELSCHGGVQHHLGSSEFDPKCHAGALHLRIPSHSVDANEDGDGNGACHGGMQHHSGPSEFDPKCHAGALHLNGNNNSVDSNDPEDVKINDNVNVDDLHCHGGVEHNSGPSKFDPKCHAGALHLRIPMERLNDNSHIVDANELQCHGGVQRHLGSSEFDPKCHAGALHLRIPSHSVDANELGDDSDACHGVVQQDMGPSIFDPKCHAGSLYLRNPTERFENNTSNSVDGNDPGHVKISDSINASDLKCHGDVQHHLGASKFDPKCHAGAMHLRIPTQRLDDNIYIVDANELSCHGSAQHHLGASKFDPNCHAGALQLKIPMERFFDNINSVDANELSCHGAMKDGSRSDARDLPSCHGAMEVQDSGTFRIDSTAGNDKISDVISTDYLQCHGGVQQHFAPSRFGPKCHAGAVKIKMPMERFVNLQAVDANELSCHGSLQQSSRLKILQRRSTGYVPASCHGAMQLDLGDLEQDEISDGINTKDLQCHGGVQKDLAPSRFDPKCHAGVAQQKMSTEDERYDNCHVVNVDELGCHGVVQQDSQMLINQPRTNGKTSDGVDTNVVKCHGSMQQELRGLKINQEPFVVDINELSCHGSAQRQFGMLKMEPTTARSASSVSCHGAMQRELGWLKRETTGKDYTSGSNVLQCHAGAVQHDLDSLSIDAACHAELLKMMRHDRVDDIVADAHILNCHADLGLLKLGSGDARHGKALSDGVHGNSVNCHGSVQKGMRWLKTEATPKDYKNDGVDHSVLNCHAGALHQDLGLLEIESECHAGALHKELGLFEAGSSKGIEANGELMQDIDLQSNPGSARNSVSLQHNKVINAQAAALELFTQPSVPKNSLAQGGPNAANDTASREMELFSVPVPTTLKNSAVAPHASKIPNPQPELVCKLCSPRNSKSDFDQVFKPEGSASDPKDHVAEGFGFFQSGPVNGGEEDLGLFNPGPPIFDSIPDAPQSTLINGLFNAGSTSNSNVNQFGLFNSATTQAYASNVNGNGVQQQGFRLFEGSSRNIVNHEETANYAKGAARVQQFGLFEDAKLGTSQYGSLQQASLGFHRDGRTSPRNSLVESGGYGVNGAGVMQNFAFFADESKTAYEAGPSQQTFGFFNDVNGGKTGDIQASTPVPVIPAANTNPFNVSRSSAIMTPEQFGAVDAAGASSSKARVSGSFGFFTDANKFESETTDNTNPFYVPSGSSTSANPVINGYESRRSVLSNGSVNANSNSAICSGNGAACSSANAGLMNGYSRNSTTNGAEVSACGTNYAEISGCNDQGMSNNGDQCYIEAIEEERDQNQQDPSASGLGYVRKKSLSGGDGSGRFRSLAMVMQQGSYGAQGYEDELHNSNRDAVSGYVRDEEAAGDGDGNRGDGNQNRGISNGTGEGNGEVEVDYARRGNWMRAAILGANDGLVSTASLMMGVGAVKHDDARAMLVSGLAGLVAGACSMAIGEFVSVYSQREAELQAKKQHRMSASHRSSQINPDRPSTQPIVMQSDTSAVDTTAANPWEAAAASGLFFALGALVPLLSAGFISHHVARIVVMVLVSGAALAGMGAYSARLSGPESSVTHGAARVLFGGWGAMLITFILLRLFGAAGI